MDSHVLIKLCSLLKWLVAHWTQEWFRSWMSPQMVHHIALFVKFFTAAVKATKEDGIQSLSVLVHYLFSVKNHPFSFTFFEPVIEDLQFMQEIFHGSRRRLLLFLIYHWGLNLMVKDTILALNTVFADNAHRLDAGWMIKLRRTEVLSDSALEGLNIWWTIAGIFMNLNRQIILLLLEGLLLFPFVLKQAITCRWSISYDGVWVICCWSLHNIWIFHCLLMAINHGGSVFEVGHCHGLLSNGQGVVTISLCRSYVTIL